MTAIILKSASPRRKSFLQYLGFSFQIVPAHIDETPMNDEKPLDYLQRMTRAKLEKEKARPDILYISSDTIVVYQEEILLKPESKTDALKTLQKLNNSRHFVYTGLGLLINNQEIYDFAESEIYMKDWQQADRIQYVEQYQPYDKAGSYGIQDKQGPVKSIQGSYSNVVGFPLSKFYQYSPIWQPFLVVST